MARGRRGLPDEFSFFLPKPHDFWSQSARRRFLKRPAFTLIGPFMRGKPTRKEQQTCLLCEKERATYQMNFFYCYCITYKAQVDEIIKLGFIFYNLLNRDI